jgi:hypothetical protein
VPSRLAMHRDFFRQGRKAQSLYCAASKPSFHRFDDRFPRVRCWGSSCYNAIKRLRSAFAKSLVLQGELRHCVRDVRLGSFTTDVAGVSRHLMSQVV